MAFKNKKTLTLLFLAGCVLAGYWLWLSLRPVEIVAIHRENNFSDVLVKSYPFTDKGKINWWLENKNMLKEKYNVPNPADDGYFSISFWLFGDGYKEEEKYDRLCFNDMKTKVNCIEKDIVFTVSNSKNRGTIFTVYEGKYRQDKNGDIVKLKNESEVR